ncbi:hypothetical protein MJO29_002363 [Puccinia striiformis f. sp. tritici]|nr:hypothetical protein MJO29_002363 [Puccinia striiformis f. sp. tritici]
MESCDLPTSSSGGYPPTTQHVQPTGSQSSTPDSSDKDSEGNEYLFSYHIFTFQDLRLIVISPKFNNLNVDEEKKKRRHTSNLTGYSVFPLPLTYLTIAPNYPNR